MSQSNVESLLRRTLAEHAETITSAPAWNRSTASHVSVRAPRRRAIWFAPLGAAATVVALVIALVTTQHHTPAPPPPAPATQVRLPTLSPTATTSTAPTTPHPPDSGPMPSATPVPLPATWKDAFAQPGSGFGATRAEPMSVAADGTVVLYLDYGPVHGRPRQVALLRPGSSAPQIVFTVPDPDSFTVSMASLYQHWLVVATSLGGRAAKGTVPGDSPMPNVHQLLVIDLSTGAATTIASTAIKGGPTIDEAVVFGSTVYWVSHPKYNDVNGSWHGYDLKTRRATVLGSGGIGYMPAITPLGLYAADVAVENPSVGDRATLSSLMPSWSLEKDVRPSLVTDGTDYAWLEPNNVVAWWAHGSGGKVRRFRVSAEGTEPVPPTLIVNGRYVFVVGAKTRVLDTRTGAIASLPVSTVALTQPAVAANAKTVAGWTLTAGTGAWVDGYWLDPQPQVFVVDTATLPRLGN